MKKLIFFFTLLIFLSFTGRGQNVTLTPSGSSHEYTSANKITFQSSGGEPVELKTTSIGYIVLPFYNMTNAFQGQIFAGFNTFGLNGGASNAISFWTGNGEKARISTSGNFGVGTITPEHKLDVNGEIRSSVLTGNGSKPVFADDDGVLSAGAKMELNLGNTNVIPSNNTIGYTINGYEAYMNSASSGARFFVPVNLPTGVTIDSVYYYIADNLSEKNLKLELVVTNRGGGGSSSYPLTSTGSSGYYELKRGINFTTSEHYHIYLEIYAVDNAGTATSWDNSLLKFRMARVVYSYD